MIPFPDSAPTPKKILSSVTLWLIVLVGLLHLITFIPYIKNERQIIRIEKEFYVWWNSGGNLNYDAGLDDEKTYVRLLDEKLKAYTDTQLRYRFNIVPRRLETSSIYSSFLLQSGALAGWLSLFIFMVFLFYPGLWIEQKYGPAITLGLFFGGGILSNLLYLTYIFQINFEHWGMSFSGSEGALSMLIGFLITAHQNEKIPFWYLKDKWISIGIKVPLFVSLWVVVLFFNLIFFSPTSHNKAFIINLMVLGAGALAGKYIPKKAVKAPKVDYGAAPTIDPSESVTKTGKEYLEKAWTAFITNEMDAALLNYQDAFRHLFQYPDQNRIVIKEAFERMFSQKMQMRVPFGAYYEWGQKLEGIGLYKLAIHCYERPTEDQVSPTALRQAAFHACQIRIQEQINPEQARPFLEKIIKFKADDLLGKSAQKMLNQLSNQEPA
jgi:membrane associated rhomboid family serine protease